MNLAFTLAHKHGDDLTPDELREMTREIGAIVEERGYKVERVNMPPQAAIAMATQLIDDAARLAHMLSRTPGPDLVPLPEVIALLRVLGGEDTDAGSVAMAAFCVRWGIDPEADLDTEPNEDQS